ncbi:PucR family transcriptional regulator [Nocardia sp. NPDC051929]|uniref:PucR family transcriptional regulator n=1 Tax=Nocardia sp. NPDC051929 TaxID=3364327 RepID=UPI0037CAC806
MPKGYPAQAGLTIDYPVSAVEDTAQASGYLLAAVRDCLEVSICLLDGPAQPEQLRRLEEEAARWACADIPIVTILRVVHDGVRLGIELAGDRASTEAGQLGAVDTDRVLGLLGTVTAAVARGYTRQLHTAAHQHHTATRALASALLEGQPTSTLARHNGIEVADEYWILAVAVPRPASAAAQSRVRTERPLRRIRAELAHRSQGAALSILSPTGGTILLPTALAGDSTLDEWIAAIARIAGVPVTATLIRAATPDIPSCAAQAHELLDLVHRLGLRDGLHRFADLALEYQLTRPGPGLEWLSALLDPLDEEPELLETLRCHVANGMNRRRTAQMLYLHPNTVDNRLKRIAQIIGLDATQSSGLWYLRSALIARRHRAAAPKRVRREPPTGPELPRQLREVALRKHYA